MLTFDDCVALCELTEDEIAAIAEHEHLPMIVAAELGNYLIHGPDGALRVKRIILDDMLVADRAGDKGRALSLKLVLRHSSSAIRSAEGDARHRVRRSAVR